jgi:hypothetical protein
MLPPAGPALSSYRNFSQRPHQHGREERNLGMPLRVPVVASLVELATGAGSASPWWSSPLPTAGSVPAPRPVSTVDRALSSRSRSAAGAARGPRLGCPWPGRGGMLGRTYPSEAGWTCGAFGRMLPQSHWRVPMRYKVGAEQFQQVPSLAHRPDGCSGWRGWPRSAQPMPSAPGPAPWFAGSTRRRLRC